MLGGLALIMLGLIMLSASVWVLRLLVAHRKAEKYIQTRGITSGIYVKHGMVVDENGMITPTSSPSHYAIMKFWK